MTFISHIDGSVQYFGFLPSSGDPGPKALVLSLHGDGLPVLQTQIDPGLQVLGPGNDLRPHLEGLDVEEHGKRGIVLTPQVPVSKA